MKNMPRPSARGAAAVVVGGGVLALTLVGGPAASAGSKAHAAKAVTIKMVIDDKGLRFAGPATVRRGQRLRIVNATRPKRIGPHTFTLAAKRLLPKSRKAQQKCFAPGRVCMKAAKAHQFDEQTGAVSRPLVSAGRAGWDRTFTLKRNGDSWYTDKKNETLSQRVTANAGRTINYMCIVHPEMQGKIRVLAKR